VTRRLVVCCDGTWNTASDDTNVRRLYERLARTDDQLPRYFEGLGADGNPVSRLLDGAFGVGLAEAVREVYRWLAETFRPGDELVLLGFSRGAFTVRSVVGMLAQCGLVVFGPTRTTRSARRRSSACSSRATARSGTSPRPAWRSTPGSGPTTVPIGPTGERELTAPRGGYLYAFANDAWSGYASNDGAVALRVTRVG
jgi:hypothetical protein